jgi:hypothetical protein
MKKTLQDQYLLIKEGKGHKGVFLTEAKRDFPHIVPNAATFEEAAASLKTKNIISENVIGLNVINGYEPRKKESYENAFEAFLAEAKKKKEEDEKAELKKTSKQVEEDLEHNFDRKDEKNPDNLIFDQIMTGYYAEMKDPKNAEKTMQELKDMVFKNLAKDPIYYTKDGQFGVKGLGYTTEAPGLGTPKEATGKYKSSGYGNLSEGMGNEDPLERTARIELNMLGYSYAVLPHYTRQDLIDTLRRESKERFGKKELDDLADQLEATLEEAKESWRDRFTEKPSKSKFSDEEKEADRKKKREAEFERRRKAGESLEEITLRRAIQEMINTELKEMIKINPVKGGGGRRNPPSDIILSNDVIKKFDLSNPGPNAPSYNESIKIPHIKISTSESTGLPALFISNFLDIALKGITRGRTTRETEVAKNTLQKMQGDITDKDWSMVRALIKKYAEVKPIPYPVKGKTVLYHKVSFPSLPSDDQFETGYSLDKIDNGLKINLPKKKEEKKKDFMESLRESVEKDLAAINKEAEQEVLQSKLDKIAALIDKKQSQLGKLDEDEDMKALTDSKKVKEIQKDIKALEKAKSKVEKMMGKGKNKKKEVLDEMDAEEIAATGELDQDTINGVTEKYDEIWEKNGIVTDQDIQHIANLYPFVEKSLIVDYLTAYGSKTEPNL